MTPAHYFDHLIFFELTRPISGNPETQAQRKTN